MHWRLVIYIIYYKQCLGSTSYCLLIPTELSKAVLKIENQSAAISKEHNHTGGRLEDSMTILPAASPLP